MTHPSRQPLLLVAALGAILAGACSFEEETPAVVDNRCAANVDCAEGICDVSVGMCIAAAPDRVLHIALEITHAAEMSGAPSTFLFGPIEVDSPTHADVVLPLPVTVFGNVRAPGLATEGAVRANVRFLRRNTFPGGPRPQVESATSREPMLVLGEHADYALQVAPGQEYDVIVEPVGETASVLPPLRTSVDLRELGGGNSARVDLTFPTGLQVLNGELVHTDESPAVDLQVQAVEPETGLVVSSTARTGADGSFTLHVQPSGPYVLRVSGGDEESPFPTLIADPSYFFPDDTGFVTVLVPRPAAVVYIGSVEPAGRPGEPVQGAVVTLRSVDVFDDTTGVSGSYQTTAPTDADGRFRATVFPGSYEVVIAPPSGMALPGDAQVSYPDLGVLAETVRIERPGDGVDSIMGQLFELPGRAVLGGTVLSPDGRQMPGTTVQADALGRIPEGFDAATRYNRSGNATTDATGQFRLPLDFGMYDVLVKPPTETGFPWAVAPGLTFGSGTEFRNDFELSVPVPLSGAVTSGSASGPTLPGAEVRAWAIVESAEGTLRSVRVGRATTGDAGKFTLLLPSRL